jgi:hypothetical protein
VTTAHPPAHDLLTAAGSSAGVDTANATLIRDGSQVLYRLRGAIVARIGRRGRTETARHEVVVSRWLAENGVPGVRLVAGVPQPTIVGDRAVTWWHLIPDHRAATTAELGAVLRVLHGLPIPEHLQLPEVDPLEGLAGSIDGAVSLFPDDHAWLVEHLEISRSRLAALPAGLPRCVIHGDAWQGNIAVPATGTPVLLDLESTGIGRPEWDLISLAADLVDFARITVEDYEVFVQAYGGMDVIGWPGFRTLADVRELRWTCFSVTKALTDATVRREAEHRIACLRGKIERPWNWSAL